MADFAGRLHAATNPNYSSSIAGEATSPAGGNAIRLTHRDTPGSTRNEAMKPPFIRRAVPAVVAIALLGGATAEAQVVYYGALRPVVAAPVVAAPIVAAPVAVAPTYVANYTPAGNYAAVTAFSPPVVTEPAAVAVRAAYAPVVAAAPVAVTSYYAPAAVAPTVAYYAPPVVAPVVTPVVAAPVTAYYPGVLYRRGPLGVYRPVRSAYYISY